MRKKQATFFLWGTLVCGALFAGDAGAKALEKTEEEHPSDVNATKSSGCADFLKSLFSCFSGTPDNHDESNEMARVEPDIPLPTLEEEERLSFKDAQLVFIDPDKTSQETH